MVLSNSSTPVNLDLSHLSLLREALASGICRARERMCPIASSAAEITFEVGALTTITPALVAALISTLSNPTPALAITFSCLAAPIASASSCVAERTRIAEAVASSASKTARSVPSMFLISKSGPKAETVAGESSSAISTIGLVTKGSKGLR
ncbi:unannotated protein [freshwater metagenome]|uniref:Unannotated protein n=1 Tax=freshwater metagenome TaxID=449393 RepID=A0A6J6DT79_9ZZZZ